MNKKESLDKLLKMIENDEELKQFGEIEQDTKDILEKMRKGEINPARASEIFLSRKEKKN